jgi:hypothetical protein
MEQSVRCPTLYSEISILVFAGLMGQDGAHDPMNAEGQADFRIVVTDAKRSHQAINASPGNPGTTSVPIKQSPDQNIATVMTPPARNKLGQRGLKHSGSD